MNSPIKNMFFASIPLLSARGDEIEIQNILASLKVASRMMNESVYVVDFYHRCFRFVSDHQLFLCGHSQEKALQLGYEFYRHVIHEDLPLVINIHRVIYHYLHHSETRLCDIDYIAFNFSIGSNTEQQMVCHKATPLMIDSRPQVAICTVSESVRTTSGNLMVYYKNSPDCGYYSFEKQKWKPWPGINLSTQEKKLLLLARRGQSKEAAEILCISKQSVRNLRQDLYRKLDVSSMEQALIFAKNHHLKLN